MRIEKKRLHHHDLDGSWASTSTTTFTFTSTCRSRFDLGPPRATGRWDYHVIPSPPPPEAAEITITPPGTCPQPVYLAFIIFPLPILLLSGLFFPFPCGRKSQQVFLYEGTIPVGLSPPSNRFYCSAPTLCAYIYASYLYVLDFPLCPEILSSTSSSLHTYLLFLGEGEKLYVLIPQRKNGAGALDVRWKGFDGNTPQIADK